MKTLNEAIEDAIQSLMRQETTDYSSISNAMVEHITPLLSPPLDSAALRRAEVARIAEALYCRYQTHPQSDMTTDYALHISFLEAEAFISYRESLELPKKI